MSVGNIKGSESIGLFYTNRLVYILILDTTLILYLNVRDGVLYEQDDLK